MTCEGRAEGRAEGHAEGLTKGRTEGKLQVAKTMLANGVPVSDVLKYTGLSKEDLGIE